MPRTANQVIDNHSAEPNTREWRKRSQAPTGRLGQAAAIMAYPAGNDASDPLDPAPA